MSDFAKDINVPTNDCISRQAAIDALSLGKEILSRVLDDMDVVGTDREKYSWGLGLIESNIKDIKELPSAQPERETGRWLIREGISDAQCSECKMYFKDVYDMDNSDAFCRHCGAKMEGLKVVNDERFDKQTSVV